MSGGRGDGEMDVKEEEREGGFEELHRSDSAWMTCVKHHIVLVNHRAMILAATGNKALIAVAKGQSVLYEPGSQTGRSLLELGE